MGKKLNLKGQIFDRLVVLDEAGRNHRKQLLWRCKCRCGNERLFSTTKLREGKTKSCGCISKERELSGDLTGQRSGRLTVLRISHKDKRSAKYWLCSCECGKQIKIHYSSLKSGRSKSCGCWNKELMAKRNYQHGMSKTPMHNTWSSMIQRCSDKKSPSYPRYGGRGIEVCDRWRKSFKLFLADMGDRPNKAYSLERKDNNGNYSPGNCIWGTAKQQSRNRRSNRYLTYKGETKLLVEWAEALGMNINRISTRLHRGWSVERALSTPLKKEVG